MNLQKHRFGHRRGSPQGEEEASPPLTNRTNVDYRNSALNQYKINPDYQNHISPSYNRYSFDIEAPPSLQRKLENEVRFKMNSIQSIRNTLSELKKKIDTAKESLQTNNILNKNIIQEEPDDEELKPFELISFSESSGSQMVNSSSLDESKRQFLEQLRKYEIPDISFVKGYYKSEVVKALKDGSGEILNHIAFNWKVLRSCGGLQEPSAQDILKQKTKIKLSKAGKRTLVLGLNGTLVYVDQKKKNEEDIDVTFKLQNNFEKKAYISLRPYAMTFLKKMSKLYEIIIFSDRSKGETDAILDVLDPFSQMITVRVNQESCMRIRNGVLTKDLRVFDRDLSQMLLVDCQPYSYLFQIDNAVPILPFHHGIDDQLYGLQKYLGQAVRSSELRKFNRNYFQLNRYSQFGSAFEAVQNLYLHH